MNINIIIDNGINSHILSPTTDPTQVITLANTSPRTPLLRDLKRASSSDKENVKVEQEVK
jgi:hypothetical protein